MKSGNMIWHGLKYGKGEQNIHVETNLSNGPSTTENEYLKQKIRNTMLENAPADAGVHNIRTAWFSYFSYETNEDRMTASINFDANRDLEDSEYEKMAQAVFDTTEEIRNRAPWKSISSDYGVYVETVMEINLGLDEEQRNILNDNGFSNKVKQAAYALPINAGVTYCSSEYTLSKTPEGGEVTNILLKLRSNRELRQEEKQFVVDKVNNKKADILENDFGAAVNSIVTDTGSLEK